MIAPLVGWDFTRTTQIDTAQAQPVDLGDHFSIGAKHQKIANDRASRGLNQGHMAPGDPFPAAVETDPIRLARDKDDPGLLIRLIGNSRQRDLEARVEQGRVNAILAKLSCYRRGRDDASERLILAGPDLRDATEGRSVDQAVRSESAIELSAIDPAYHSPLDRLHRDGSPRWAVRQRHCTGDRDRGQRGCRCVAAPQTKGAILARQGHLDQGQGAGANQDWAPDLEALDLGPIASGARQNRRDRHLDVCGSRQDHAVLNDVIGEPGKQGRIEPVLPDPVGGSQTLPQ